MFWQTYKTTIKNLFRSVTFWLLLMVFSGIVISESLGVSHGISLFDENGKFVEFVYDNDPKFILSYGIYIKRIINTVKATIMLYAMPMFTVISVVLILNRDYGDSFYEIEKSTGHKPSTYLFGRLSALVTVNFILAMLASFVALHLYVFTRGGVAHMEFLKYMIDSTARMMRVIACVAWPTILFYIGITYFFGSLFKSGKVSAVVSLTHVMASYFINAFAGRIFVPKVYTDYFSTQPQKLFWYLYHYDTSSFEETIMAQNTNFEKAAFCVVFLIAVGGLFSVFSCFLVRKREL